MTANDEGQEDVWTVLDRIREKRKALGLRGRSREEIDEAIRAMRDEWDEHLNRTTDPCEQNDVIS